MPIILTTGQNIEGKKISNYHGVIAGNAVLGSNILRDFFSSIKNIVGGQSAAYEAQIEQARQIAFDEIIEKASKNNANAVIGIKIDYEHMAGGILGEGMLMVCITGTAVSLS